MGYLTCVIASRFKLSLQHGGWEGAPPPFSCLSEPSTPQEQSLAHLVKFLLERNCCHSATQQPPPICMHMHRQLAHDLPEACWRIYPARCSGTYWDHPSPRLACNLNTIIASLSPQSFQSQGTGLQLLIVRRHAKPSAVCASLACRGTRTVISERTLEQLKVKRGTTNPVWLALRTMYKVGVQHACGVGVLNRVEALSCSFVAVPGTGVFVTAHACVTLGRKVCKSH